MSSLASPYKHPVSGIYYLRIGVPKPLRSAVKKTVIKQSLRTKDFTVAKQRFAVVYAEAMALLQQYRHQKQQAPVDLADIAQAWFMQMVVRFEDPDEITRLKSELFGCLELNEAKSNLQSALEGGYMSQLPHVQKTANRLTQELSLGLIHSSVSYRLLIEKLCWRLLDLCQMMLAKSGGQAVLISPNPSHVFTKVSSNESTESFKSLGSVVKDYIKHKQSQRDWEKTTEKDVLNIYELLLDEMDKSTNPSDITREQFRDFLTLLTKLPAYYTNTKRFEKYPLNKVIAMADEEGLPRITPSTVRKKFSFVKALFKFALHEEWVDRNRTVGVQIKIEGTEAVRKPYTEEEIKIIMSTTRHKKRPSDYWMPRVALTTGMRANEILQLLVKDIRCYEGIWYIDINMDIDPHTGFKKKLKTTNSIRKVPVPNVLMELGFLDFVTSKKEGRLFPCVSRAHDGRYSYIFSKRFNWMITRLGLKPDPSLKQLKDFHSLRHTFRANCREYGISNEDANLIGGWSSSLDPTTGDRYGKEFVAFLSQLKVSIDRVDYSSNSI